jgi:uncharacterized protein (UPF0332 family)
MTDDDTLALIQKGKESLGAARELLQEGHADFAASRAYYAMFYVAQALLLDIGQSYSKHSMVIAAFGREYTKTGILDRRFHRWLIDAQDLRNIGDYGVNIHVPEEKAELVCTWAQELIGQAEAYLTRKDDDHR